MPQHIRFFPFKAGDLAPGLPYRLLSCLGEGAFGQVWKAQHTTLQHVCALKFCRDREKFRALRNEAKHAHRIHKEGMVEGFVAMREFYDEPNRQFPCIAYEFVEGQDFETFLTERRHFGQSGMSFSPREAAEIIYELATIMALVHVQPKPFVHRDLKPANVMVLDGQLPWKFKIADFGLGVLATDWFGMRKPTLSDDGRKLGGVGTMAYMSHEQCDPARPGHPSDDVHALGVMWYELLKGDFADELFGWTPPSHCEHYDWEGLTKEVRGIGLNPKEAALLVNCLKRHYFRPTDAGVLAARIKDLYPDLPNKPSKTALVERLISNALSQIDCTPYLAELFNDEDADPAQLDAEHHAALEGAIADCNTAIHLTPQHSDAFRARGRIYEALENYRQAVADYTEAIRLDPLNSKAYLDRAGAICYEIDDDTDENRIAAIYTWALEDCDKAIDLNPKDSDAYHQRAQIYTYCDRLDDAVDDYALLIGFDANDLKAYQERAKLYRRLHRYDEALADYSTCVRLGHIPAYLDRGEVYEKMGKFQEAIHEITNFIDRSESVSFLFYQRRAALFEKLGDAANAKRDRMLAEQLIS